MWIGRLVYPQVRPSVPEALLVALPWPEHLERLSALQSVLCSESLRQVAQGDAAVAERCFQDAQGPPVGMGQLHHMWNLGICKKCGGST